MVDGRVTGPICSSASAVPGIARFGAGHRSRIGRIPPEIGLDGDLGCHRCFCKADVPQERIGSEAAQSTQLKAERAQESGSVVRKAQLLVIMLVGRGHVGQVNALRARGVR